MAGAADVLDIKEQVQRHASLKAIAGPEWDAALDDSTLARYPAGTVISADCDGSGDYITIVLKGAIKVHSASKDGRTLNIYRVRPGELCVLTLAAAHLTKRLLVQMTAEGEVLLLKVPGRHLSPLLANSPIFRCYVMSAISEHVATLINRIEETTFSPLQSRILTHLREASANSGCSVVAITHQALADELGSTREAVSRVLKEMERAGMVKLGRRTISLVGNPGGLTHLFPRIA